MEFLVGILVLVLSCKVNLITSTDTHHDRHQGLLFDNYPGYILSLPANMSHVKQMSTKVSSKMDCTLTCGTTPWCRSVNFKIKAEKDGRHICELIGGINYTNTKHLKQDEEFTHLSINNPCEDKPCPNQAICIPEEDSLGYRCRCKEGYAGNECQKDVDECIIGSNDCHPDANCINSPGSFSCQCKPGLLGDGKNCTPAKKDCSEYYQSGARRNRVYTIQPDSQGPFPVYCDMTTDGGGWTVFQRRQDGSVTFYLGWKNYTTGFGNLSSEFWLGNDYIHRLTARTPSALRVDMEDWAGVRKYAKYGSLSVSAESDKYRLSVGSYSGDAGDSMAYHNNMAFSTKDRDNDVTSGNCAVMFTGAWWYKNCHQSNLNGQYLGNVRNDQGINWYGFSSYYDCLKFSEMKVRPNTF